RGLAPCANARRAERQILYAGARLALRSAVAVHGSRRPPQEARDLRRCGRGARLAPEPVAANARSLAPRSEAVVVARDVRGGREGESRALRCARAAASRAVA